MDGDILDDDGGGRGGRPVLLILSRTEADEEEVGAGAAASPNDATLSNEWYCVKDTPPHPAIDDDVMDKSSLSSAIMAVEYVSGWVGSDEDMLDFFVLNCMLLFSLQSL